LLPRMVPDAKVCQKNVDELLWRVPV